MEGLVTFLLFAGLFYFLMRFGCGAHAVHGHGGGHGGHTGHGGQGEDATQQGAPGVDPVCGMTVSLGKGYSVTHAGRDYRLCSRTCLDKFESNPGQYASAHGGVP